MNNFSPLNFNFNIGTGYGTGSAGWPGSVPSFDMLRTGVAYNLGNFLRRLCLPKAVKHWSLRSVQIKLIKIGGAAGASRPAAGVPVR
mgnify:CR=1 FL=1